MERIGEFRYDGNGQLLNNGETYTLFDTGSEIEAYPDGSGDPVEMNRGVFASLRSGRLERLEGATPMR